MVEYDLDLDGVVSEVRASGSRRVGLQFPEGLKDRAVDVAAYIEALTDADVVVFADPTYGACDMKCGAAEKLGVDLLVHFGHTKFR